jgi:FkbM family methyltransferase
LLDASRTFIKRRLIGKLPYRLVLVLKELEVVTRTMLLKRYYESEEPFLAGLLKSIARQGVAIDVGANLGQYSLFLARVPQCQKIIAVEPQREVAGILGRVCWLLRLNKIKVLETCAGEHTGQAYLHTPVIDGIVAGQETHIVDDPASNGARRVHMTSIDDIVRSYAAAGDSLVLLKMDVEGAEMLVLRGASETIDKHRPLILAELVDSYLARYECTFDSVCDFLKEKGYDPFILQSGGLVRVVGGSPERSESGNYFFLHKEDHGEIHKQAAEAHCQGMPKLI